ncbi:hypothetical protein EXS56_01610 [Candidatus Kaiserbacteria bacterium]|nr:hypothetical protein [Candidatus Kaiserbacteria bacterium]
MPPETQVIPPSQTSAKAPFHKTIVGLIVFAVILVAIAAGVGWFGFSTPPSVAPTGTPETLLPVPKGLQEAVAGTNGARVTEIARLNMAGEYQAAIAAYTNVMQEPSLTADQRARATIFVSWARFNLSGNVQDLVYDIKEMKKQALNQDVSVALRVNLINLIGSAYGTRQTEIFDAIYSGTTFANFRVEGDGALSGRKLFGWSYSLKPTSQAAVRIARWYIETSLFQKPVVVPPAEVAERVQAAVRYMGEAKVLEAQERAATDNIENSSDHMLYMYWYALESGYLARLRGGDSFVGTYKQAYADFFAEAATSDSPSTLQKLPYAHYFLANALFKVDKDRVAAGAELDKAIDAVNSYPNPKASQFVEFVKNDGIYDKERAYMRGMSAKFDAFLDALGK